MRGDPYEYGVMEITLSTSVLPRTPQAATIWYVSDRNRTDEDLLVSVGDGDRGAFEVLYRRYARAVLGLALRRLGDRGRAEDAVQEAFAAIWRSAKSYRPERGPGAPWLYAVARNAISDRGRARTEPPTQAPEEASPEPGPDEQAHQGWLAWRVHRALDELPENERRLIELAYWGGLSQSEIAEMLGIPLGTVKTRTRSALMRLAGDLERDELR
jgi:RNA polymerase sigma-70 factor (ECF subfamily)